MKKIILLISVWTLGICLANAQTFTVNSLGGNCDAWYYDIASDVTPLTGTLQEGIYRHRQGQAITNIVFAATLNGQIKSCTNTQFLIDKPNLTIDGKNQITISSTGGNSIFEISGASNVVIRGLNLDGTSNPVIIKNSTNVTVINSTISKADQSGIKIQENSSNIILDSLYVFDNKQSGVEAINSQSITLRNSVIGLNKSGVKSPNATLNNTTRANWNTTANASGSINNQGVSFQNISNFTINNNVVSGNNGHGIYVLNSNATVTSKISNNRVGLNLDQSNVIGNFGQGIYIKNSKLLDIEFNHISGNGNGKTFLQNDQVAYENMMGVAIYIIENSQNIGVYGNLLGTDKTGNAYKVGSVDFGNHHEAMHLNAVNNVVVGDRTDLKRNVVGGNGYGFSHVRTVTPNTEVPGTFFYGRFHGITLANSAPANTENNKIIGNFIGVGKDKVSNISNAGDQISVQGYVPSPYGLKTQNNIIGGDDILDANYIGGGAIGINISGDQAQKNIVKNNFIGVSNISGKVTVVGTDVAINLGNSNSNIIGEEGKPNYIFGYPKAIVVDGVKAITNKIIGNVLAQNKSKGITLTNSGNKQYGPVYLNTAVLTDLKAQIFTPAIGDRIDIYVADIANGFGPCQGTGLNSQGKTWVGSEISIDVLTAYTDQLSGKGYFEVDLSKYASKGLLKSNIIVTATDKDGNTSEFNTCTNKVPCKAPTAVAIPTKLYNLCQGDSAKITYSFTFPSDEAAKAHKFKLYKLPNVTSAVDSNTTGAAFIVKSSGNYKLEAYNPNSKALCSLLSSDTVKVNFGTIPVVGTISLKGGGDLCENVKGKVYKVAPFTAGSSFLWTVTGATVNGANSRDSLVLDFTTAGNVTLKVVEISKAPFSCQSKNTTTLSFAVNPNPKPVITGKMELCNQADGVYKVSNPGGSTYVWTVNGGTKTNFVSSDSIKVKWTATTATSLLVEETTKFSCKGTSVSTPVTVNPLPVVPTLSSLKELCALDTFSAVISNAVVGNTYNWTATGATPASATGSTVKFAANKTADSLIFVLTTTTNKGCISLVPTRFAVDVNPLPNPGSLSILPAGNLCQTDTIKLSFTPTVGAKPTWTSNPAAFLTKALDPLTNSTVRFLADQTATVSVSETFTATGCKTDKSDVKSITVNINAKPAKPVIIGGASAICLSTGKIYTVTPADPKATYTWIYENIKNPTVPSGVPTLGASSTTVDFGEVNAKMKVVVKSEFGCMSDTSLVKSIVVNGCVFSSNIGTDVTENCFGEKITFKNLSSFNTPGPISYTWDFDVDNLGGSTPKTSSLKDPGAISYTKSGTYKIKLTMKDDLLGSDPKFVDDTIITFTVNPLPVFTSFGGPAELCSDDTKLNVYAVSETPGSSYEWTIPSGATIAAQSATKNSISVVFPFGTKSGTIKVKETTSKGCTKDTSMAVTVNNPPKKGSISATPNKVCENEEVKFVYTGEGSKVNWMLNSGTDASLVTDANSTLTVKMGKKLAVVVAYAESDKGCSNPKDTSLFSLTPILLPDTSLLEIQGPHNLCIGKSADYTAATSETDLAFKWISGPHTLNTANNLQTINITVGNSGPIILEVSRGDGLCKVSDLRYNVLRFEKPVLPRFTNLPSKVCASVDSLKLKFNAIDTVFYDWKIEATEARKILSSTSGLGKDLDSLLFNVGDNSKFVTNDCSPKLSFGVRVSYIDPVLKECYDSASIATLPVILRLDSLNKLHFSVNHNTIGSNQFECNLFDGRFDSSAYFKNDTICGIPSTTYLYDWSDFKLEDRNKDGVFESYPADLIVGSKDQESIRVNWTNEATNNIHYYFKFKIKLTSKDCVNDFKEDTLNYQLLPSDTVDYKIKQKSLVCVDDSIRLDIKNVLLPSPSLDTLASYTWYYSGVDTMYTSIYNIVKTDTVINGRDTSYVNRLTKIIEYSLYNEDYSVRPTYRSNLSFDQQAVSLPNKNVLGFPHFIQPTSELNKWMKIVANPRYCTVNKGYLDSAFVDSIGLEVVSRPGVAINGILGDVPADKLLSVSTFYKDSMTVDKIEDKFVLFDVFNRDSSSSRPYVYPKGKESVNYNWGWVYSKDSIATAGLSPSPFTFEVSPTFINRPESVDYILVTSQVNASKKNICSDTARFKVNVGYTPWIPNIFSPNGDGSFDVWKIRNIDKYPNNKVTIFNRWGTLLLEIKGYNNIDKVWDGRVRGEDVPAGTYFYLVNYGDGFKEVSGAVSVIK